MKEFNEQQILIKNQNILRGINFKFWTKNSVK